jgi:hypothetical protein
MRLKLIAILIFAGLQAFGQATQPSADVLHAGTNEVLLDLVVHDKKNKPVRDLRPDIRCSRPACE